MQQNKNDGELMTYRRSDRPNYSWHIETEMKGSYRYHSVHRSRPWRLPETR